MVRQRSVLLAEDDPEVSEGLVRKAFYIFYIPALLDHLNFLKQATVPQSRGPGLVQQLSIAAAVLLCASGPSPALAMSFQITGIRVQNGSAIVTWQGGGASNQVQRASSLSGPWQNVG